MKLSPEGVEVVVDDVSNSSLTKKMPIVTKKLVLCGLGIFVSYFYYGILQERITRGKYGDGEKSETFTFTMALVATQCVVNAIFAKAVMRIWRQGEDETPTRYYPVVAFTYLGAMVASNSALQHINYPTQVLGKSVKPIPVMLLGVLFAGKRYHLAKYLCVLLIVIGVALFVYKDKNSSKVGEHTFGWGEIFLLISLTLDGLTGATQEKMKSVAKTKPYHMMYSMNLWSIAWLSIGLISTGELWQYIAFVQRYPHVLVNILIFSLCSAIGQNFIFITVTSFGPLTCSIITTTRKFFTILASVIFFGNSMSQRQWIGTLLVFIGLGLDSKFGKAKHKH